jgi:hypothetical protein
MANMSKLTNILPLTTSDLEDVSEFAITKYELELQRDILNVLEGRVELNTFEPEYQERIKNYYRFHGNRFSSKNPKIAARTPDTGDVI